MLSITLSWESEMATNLREAEGVREYCEEFAVKVGTHEETGRLIVQALNEGGHNGTEIDLRDLIGWLKGNMPDLLAEFVTAEREMATSAERERCIDVAKWYAGFGASASVVATTLSGGTHEWS